MNKIKHLRVKQLLLCSILLLASFLSLASVKDMQQLVVEQKFQAAYQLGNELLTEEAGNPSFDMLYGMAASRVAKYEQALFAFERVLIFDNTAPVPRFELARIHYELGNFITARFHFNLVQESQPKPPLEILSRIQWYLATIDAREAGKAVAANDGITRIYLGARFGFDSNPSNYTHKSVMVNIPLIGQDTIKYDVESDTFHELTAGISRFQQQGESWGWFLGGDASLRGYHDKQDDMDNYSLGLQAGGILLGKTWRLSLPLQINQQVRDDDNEVLVLAMAAEFNHRLTTKTDYTLFGQVAAIDYKPTNNRDAKSYTTGLIFSYRTTDQLRYYAGPIYGVENADEEAGKEHGRDLFGIRTGSSYAITDRQRFDLNLNYLNTKHHDKTNPLLGSKTRSDDQLSMGIKYSYRYPKDWLFDLGLQHSQHMSNINLYTYHRTQISAGIRKEW